MRATPVQTPVNLTLPLANPNPNLTPKPNLAQELTLPLANPNPDLSPKPNLAQELHRPATLARLS